MDLHHLQMRSNPGFGAGLEQFKATLLANGQTATVSLLAHCSSAPMQVSALEECPIASSVPTKLEP